MSATENETVAAIEKVIRLLKGLQGALEHLTEIIESKESVKQ